MSATDHPAPVYRIDRFRVPVRSRTQFLERVRAIQAFLADMAGCRQNLVLEEPASDGASHVLTIVEWESAAAMDAARARVQTHYARIGFDPRETMARLGIKPEFGMYREPAEAGSKAHAT